MSGAVRFSFSRWVTATRWFGARPSRRAAADRQRAGFSGKARRQRHEFPAQAHEPAIAGAVTSVPLRQCRCHPPACLPHYPADPGMMNGITVASAGAVSPASSREWRRHRGMRQIAGIVGPGRCQRHRALGAAGAFSRAGEQQPRRQGQPVLKFLRGIVSACRAARAEKSCAWRRCADSVAAMAKTDAAAR